MKICTAVAYLRTSTRRQIPGLDVQQAEITRWSKRTGVNIVSWHVDDGVSGAATVAKRPGLARALGAICMQKADMLVVAQRDRLAETALVARAIEKAVCACGASVVSANGIGEGDDREDEFARTLVNVAARYERAMTASRTSATLGFQKTRGRVGAISFRDCLLNDGPRLEIHAQGLKVTAFVRDDVPVAPCEPRCPLDAVSSTDARASQDHAVAMAVLEWMTSRNAWVGTATELLCALTTFSLDSRSGVVDWPTAANVFTQRLRRAVPLLSRMGIAITEHRDKASRLLAIVKHVPPND